MSGRLLLIIGRPKFFSDFFQAPPEPLQRSFFISNVPFYLISLIYLTGGLVAVGDRGQASIRFFGYSALFYLLGIEIGGLRLVGGSAAWWVVGLVEFPGQALRTRNSCI